MFRLHARHFVATLTAFLAIGLSQAARASETLFRTALDSTVFIHVPLGGDKAGFGSGVLINTAERIIITAYHVAENKEEINCFFAQRDLKGDLITDPSYYLRRVKTLGITAKVVKTDEKHDLAIFRLDRLPTGAKALPVAARSPSPGEGIHAIGNSGIADGTLWHYSHGSVRQVYSKNIRYPHDNDGGTQIVNARIVESQCPTNPGDSGGPLFNDKGELIAITTGAPKGTETLIAWGIDVTEVHTILASAHITTTLARNTPPAGSPFPAPGPIGGNGKSPYDAWNINNLRPVPPLAKAPATPPLFPSLPSPVSKPETSNPLFPSPSAPETPANPPAPSLPSLPDFSIPVSPPTPTYPPVVTSPTTPTYPTLNPPVTVFPPAAAFPDLPPVAAQPPVARVTAVRTTANTVSNGQLGILFTVDLELDGAVGLPCEVTAIFADSAGRTLPAASKAYSTTNGRNLATYFTVRALYQQANLRNVTLFIPYTELPQTGLNGEARLKVFIDVWSRTDATWITKQPATVFVTLPGKTDARSERELRY